MTISREVGAQLSESLEGLKPGGEETRIFASESWLFFLKSRTDGNRCLLSHPEDREWVATIAIDEKDIAIVQNRLKELTTGSFRLSEVVELSDVGNFDLEIQLGS